MATETYTRKGLTISFDDGDFTTGTVSVLLDLDMRTGTPVDETAWLDGGAAAGSYPGGLAGFGALPALVAHGESAAIFTATVILLG